MAVLILLVSLTLPSMAQDTLVNYYVKLGLRDNLALKQKNADFEKSLQVLRQARSYFLPAFSFNARYTLANGGREIDFPVGDLLNPVYQTLNMLTASTMFPAVENQSFNFYRPREQETKLELVQPLFNPQITYNYKIQKDVTGINLAGVNTYKRQLVADIKKGYYTYLKLLKLNDILDETLQLVKENVRLNEKLLKNHKITSDVLYRSRAALGKAEREKTAMESHCRAAANWFNFLLNRPMDSEISLPDTTRYQPAVLDRETDSIMALENREELLQMKYGLSSAEHKLKLERSMLLPTMFAVVDYGFQGVDYRFTMQHDFTLASVVFRWDLFNGMRKRAAIAEASIEMEKFGDRQQELKRQILLQVDNARMEVITAGKAVHTAGSEALAAAKGFKVTERKYQQGMASYIEYLDALTTLSNARMQVVIATYDYFISLSEYERVTATYLI